MNVAGTLEHTSKTWWRSKTLWFNLVVALAAAAEAGFAVLQPVLPVNAYAVLVFLLTVGNTALRVVTTTALALRQAPLTTYPPIDPHEPQAPPPPPAPGRAP